MEDSQVEQRHRTRPRPHLLPGLRRRGGAALRRKALGTARRPHQDLDRVQGADEAIGCGFHEAVRGVLSHHVVIRDGKIANYHPYPPTPWNANPRDIYGTPGPYEDAVQNTPIFEENGPDKFKGIDIMRAVRSFDPCLPCGVHMYLASLPGTGT
jgi:Ni,Fe-hydrogenase I large subunit